MIDDASFAIFVAWWVCSAIVVSFGSAWLLAYALMWLGRKFGNAPTDLRRGFEVKPITAGSPAARAEMKEDGHPHG